GGPRLLYVMQEAKHFPSKSTLQRNKKIPQLIVSIDMPTDEDIYNNISTMLGARPPPEDPSVGQNLMIDGVANEEVPRFIESNNSVAGFCREHSSKIKKTIDSFADLERLRTLLNAGNIHYSKDGTMFALAPVTGSKDYYPTSVLLSGSCKAETGEQIAKLVRRFIRIYNNHPMGQARHGPILQFSTDGESSFRSAHFENCLKETVTPGASILSELPGLNSKCGPDNIIGTCDPKHIMKR
ncbi:hypothetical protein B0H34DRAFT_639036, partial [Crassisporium funariophilum]